LSNNLRRPMAGVSTVAARLSDSCKSLPDGVPR
jgi:hypothetical protein